jgi:hypothetical protein
MLKPVADLQVERPTKMERYAVALGATHNWQSPSSESRKHPSGHCFKQDSRQRFPKMNPISDAATRLQLVSSLLPRATYTCDPGEVCEALRPARAEEVSLGENRMSLAYPSNRSGRKAIPRPRTPAVDGNISESAKVCSGEAIA